jgi:hypothetical protein
VVGPYARTTEQDVQRILGHRTDEVELHMVKSIRCYYLIPGTIVEVIKEDPANGMSEMRFGSVSSSLRTYTRFLSKHPVHDTYGIDWGSGHGGDPFGLEATASPPSTQRAPNKKAD